LPFHQRIKKSSKLNQKIQADFTKSFFKKPRPKDTKNLLFTIFLIKMQKKTFTFLASKNNNNKKKKFHPKNQASFNIKQKKT
jgi:hypothetical protein